MEPRRWLWDRVSNLLDTEAERVWMVVPWDLRDYLYYLYFFFFFDILFYILFFVRWDDYGVVLHDACLCWRYPIVCSANDVCLSVGSLSFSLMEVVGWAAARVLAAKILAVMSSVRGIFCCCEVMVNEMLAIPLNGSVFMLGEVASKLALW